MAQSADELKTRNKAIVRRSFDAWREGTGTPFELLTESATWTIVGRAVTAKTYQGREAFMRDVVRPFNARMSGTLKPAIRKLYTDGDTVIVLFDASGTARDGKPYQNTYAWFLDMQDGRIVNAVAFFDSIALNDYWQRVTP